MSLRKNIVEFEGSRVDFQYFRKREHSRLFSCLKLFSDKVTMENTTQEHQEIPLEVSS